MPKMIVPANVMPQTVDVPEGLERSCKGSLHIRPVSTIDITEDEWKHIQATEHDLAKKMIALPEVPKAKEAKKEEAKKDESVPPPVPPADEELTVGVPIHTHAKTPKSAEEIKPKVKSKEDKDT